jgi:predicted transcriptional regulator
MNRPTNSAERKRLILLRLQQGPASITDLMAISSRSFSQRLADLRKEGHVIRCDRTEQGSVFTLVPRAPGEQLSLLERAA